MNSFAQALACPADPFKREQASGSFYSLFRPTLPAAGCAEQAACLRQPACWEHILKGPSAPLTGYASEVKHCL